jgi:hypothetical protein
MSSSTMRRTRRTAEIEETQTEARTGLWGLLDMDLACVHRACDCTQQPTSPQQTFLV